MAKIALGGRAKSRHKAIQLEVEQASTALPWVCSEIDISEHELVRFIYGQRTANYRELSTGFSRNRAKPWVIYSGWRSVRGAGGKTIENIDFDTVQFVSLQELMDYVESELLDPLEYLAMKARPNGARRNPPRVNVRFMTASSMLKRKDGLKFKFELERLEVPEPLEVYWLNSPSEPFISIAIRKTTGSSESFLSVLYDTRNEKPWTVSKGNRDSPDCDSAQEAFDSLFDPMEVLAYRAKPNRAQRNPKIDTTDTKGNVWGGENSLPPTMRTELEAIHTALPWKFSHLYYGDHTSYDLIVLNHGTSTLRLERESNGREWQPQIYKDKRSVFSPRWFTSLQEAVDFAESKLLDPLEYLALLAKETKENPRQRTLKLDDWSAPAVLPWRLKSRGDHRTVWSHENFRLDSKAYHDGFHHVVLYEGDACIRAQRVFHEADWIQCVKDVEIQVAGGELPLIARSLKPNPKPDSDYRAAKERIQHWCTYESIPHYKSAKIVKHLGKDAAGRILFLVKTYTAGAGHPGFKFDEKSGLFLGYFIFPTRRVPGGWGFDPVNYVGDLELLGLLGSRDNPRVNKVYSPRLALTDNTSRLTSPTVLPWKLVHEEPSVTIWYWKRSVTESWEIRASRERDGRNFKIVVYALKYAPSNKSKELLWTGQPLCESHIRQKDDAAFGQAIRKIEEEIAGGGELALLALASKAGDRR